MRPYIILNCAASADGKIALANRRKLKLSNAKDFERVQKLRRRCDAILVGIGTILEDNPSLTIDSEKRIRENPIRIILDTTFRTPENAKAIDDKAKTIIATGKATNAKDRHNIELIKCGTDKVDIPKLLRKLSLRGIKSILVEGGETVMWSFIKGGYFDELNVFIASIIIGGKETPTIVGGKGSDRIDHILKIKLENTELLGNGVLLRYVKSND